MLQSCKKSSKNTACCQLHKYRWAGKDSEGAGNHCHPQVTTGCITALLPSANLYCVPGAQATPQQLESQKSAPTRGGRRFPPILSPLSVLPQSGNTLLHGFKSLLLISQRRNIIGMQSRWICQTPTLQHDTPARQS